MPKDLSGGTEDEFDILPAADACNLIPEKFGSDE